MHAADDNTPYDQYLGLEFECIFKSQNTQEKHDLALTNIHY